MSYPKQESFPDPPSEPRAITRAVQQNLEKKHPPRPAIISELLTTSIWVKSSLTYLPSSLSPSSTVEVLKGNRPWSGQSSLRTPQAACRSQLVPRGTGIRSNNGRRIDSFCQCRYSFPGCSLLSQPAVKPSNKKKQTRQSTSNRARSCTSRLSVPPCTTFRFSQAASTANVITTTWGWCP